MNLEEAHNRGECDPETCGFCKKDAADECTCYEHFGGHQMGCPQYGRRAAPASTPAKMYCDFCDGVGWYEGGKTLKTKCEKCNGTRVVVTPSLASTGALTVILREDSDDGIERADADLGRIAAGERRVVMAPPESYFHQLRLRVAEDPSLANKIEVVYLDKQGIRHEIGIRSMEDQLRWPAGFLRNLWDLQVKIDRIRHRKATGGAGK